jgi:uncharacterized coiled-coil protein SlyX
MNDELAKRLEHLESHVAHLERHIDELNEVVVEQSKLLGRLKKELQRQSGIVQSIELDRVKANNPRPPHYQ